MDADRWRRIKDLVDAAAPREGRERAAFLDEVCGGDAALRDEVEALLTAESDAEGFLVAPAWHVPVLAPGTRLGPHEIVSFVGAGGMGEVYKARDTRLQRTVAIKVLPPELAGDPDPSTSSGSSRARLRDERRQRFKREARTISRLNHPHICTLYDVGEALLRPSGFGGAGSSPESPATSLRAGPAPSPDQKVGAGFSRPVSVSYLVMEFLEGETLAARLRRGALPLAQALEYGTQIAEALAAAHKQGVIHRDLKPGNVMLTKAGAKLLDFGLAKLRAHGERPAVEAAASATESGPLTAGGVILGTLPYMAPEQVEGKSADARTDIWALGAMIYEMLTGRRAFEGDSATSLMGAILEREPEPLVSKQPLTPPALDRLVRRCLAKAPDDRWDTAHDVADELRWAGQTAATAVGPAPRPRRLGLAARTAGGLLLILAGALGTWVLRSPAPLPPVARVNLDVSPAEELNAGGIETVFLPTPGGSRTALTWTPDGRALLFVGRRGRVQQLYVRWLDSSEARPLAGTEGAQVPAISPSGLWVAFWAGGSINQVPLEGGPVQEVVSGVALPPWGMAWGADGELFYGTDDGVITERLVDGAVKTVTSVTDVEVRHSLPCVLPGGRVLLYTAIKRWWSWGDEEIVAQTLATGERKILLRDAVDARYLPSGHVVFLRRGLLFGAAFDVARTEILGTPVAMLDNVVQALTADNHHNVTGAGQFAVSNTGTLAWVPGGPGQPTTGVLVAVNRSGQVSPLQAPERAYGSLRVSSDGLRLAVNIVQPTDTGVWIYDLTRNTLTPLAQDGEAMWPFWWPGGRRLGFTWLKEGRTSVATLAADGSGVPEVVASLGAHASSVAAQASSVTPDGRQLAATSCVPGADVLIAPLGQEETAAKPWLQTSHTEWWPEFSPDGRWLAYASDLSGRFEVYVRPYPGPGAAEQVSLEGGVTPAWNVNGSELFFASPADRTGIRRMMVVEFAARPRPRIGRPRSLFVFADADLAFVCGPVRCYDVAPDGQRFYVERLLPPPPPPVVTHINLIQNWFEELKAKVGER